MRGRLASYLELVQFENTVFALPFALAGAYLGARGRPATGTILLAILAVAGLRTSAMAVNRLADRAYDARNPRTAGRALVTGEISPGRAAALAIAGLVVFVASSAALGPVAAALAPCFAALALGYSWTKRFTWASHFVLGLALSFAPLGGWVASTGTLRGYPWPLSLGVALWVAGFDIVYACQDESVDRELRLHSVPQRWGTVRALSWARGLHLAALAAWGAIGPVFGLGWPYGLGLAVVASVLVLEHLAISAADKERILWRNAARFFNLDVAA